MAANGRGIFSMDCYTPFLLRSAQRRFIDSDSRLLPSGVRRWRLFTFEAAWRGAAAPLAPDVSIPSSAATARLSRSLSRFKSATILSMSNVCSLPPAFADCWAV